MAWGEGSAHSSSIQGTANQLPPEYDASKYNTSTVTGSFITTTGTSTGPLTGGTPWQDPCAGGHHLNEDLIEYIDGTVVGNCATCNTRVVIDRVPGGVSLLRAKALLASLMSFGTDDEVVDESEVLGLLSILQKEMEAEEYALEEVREMMDLCHRIIRKKLQPNEQ